MNVKPHKQSMSELKLRRLTEHNQRLKEDLDRPRIRVSEASQRYAFVPTPFLSSRLATLLIFVPLSRFGGDASSV